MPLILLGIGHGLVQPSGLAGTAGLVPALAGSAAAVAGLFQQMSGALGSLAVGLVPHEGPVNMALLMIGWTLVSITAQALLFRVFMRRSP